MTITQILSGQLSINNSLTSFNSIGKWTGSVTQTTVAFSTDTTFQGYCLNWDGYQELPGTPFFNALYAGYNTNWGTINITGINNSFANSPYAGYNTNWGGYAEPIQRIINDIDTNSVIDHPKDQTIYYKLKGYNPLTSTFESWVISENITGRPELFDPNRNPPNVVLDLFKTPPSANNLVNVVIVARWIQ